MQEGVRIDKWLWAVRIFKSRSLASEACRSGKISIDHIRVKPSREVKEGDIIEISSPFLVRIVRVKATPGNRISAKLIENFLEDMTPPEETLKMKMKKEINFEARPRGIGRPTKKERRSIERLKRSKF
jgi:ribosome-associated heat shock protein Hsp15